ncbi:metal ABC transporter permease [Actinotignum sp. GS-2025c]|uniref:Metal ABC transporter permease n=2 Tax=Actinomycetaceae TaxID=2049 RepID=A0ABZ0RD52_9ACTO|nr:MULTISPECIES: metal ABC transporter permease [Actinotignum]WPJ89449.1 metal ABC transporter permease [Schaalia turicensis]MDE1535667.1 metal ABC transporter permease [Actinotignum schaalii]MDE1552622.1 metal ABC transporter permease [Actinotignum sanguinis]MDE1565359.1 metal ABC transporter permease [Actinotignum sanguinis]MDE1577203.1 metal ABC transporter permease [Actinotignum sanguinis]
MIADILSSPLMMRSLLVAVLVGLAAPVVGSYLVQRGMALMGDGIGHVALTGVALGWLTGTWLHGQPERFAVPGALVIAVLGALIIEWVRSAGITSGDTALAILFYGGIACGVLLISLAGGTTANLNYYLFGSVTTVTGQDVWYTVALTVVILAVGIGLRGPLFSVTNDEDFARASGLPVRAFNILIAVTAALTVAVSMRVVGILLVSAMMIVPVATAQLVCSSLAHTQRLAMGLGCGAALVGLVITRYVSASPGAMIAVILIAGYAAVAMVSTLVRRNHRRVHERV